MTILVVDDSAVMRKLMLRSLRQAGHAEAEVVQAADGVEALAAINEQQPKVVLSDWNMPNMNGLELITALREQGNDVPFGFVTSESSPDLIAQATAAGAAFLLSKPFSTDDIEAALASVGC